MSERTFPQQAIATRRQTAQLSHRTFTTERRLLFELVLRLSFDLGRAEAPVPSQAWVGKTLGLDKGDVSHAEKCLKRFGMIAVRETGVGADYRRYYKPQPDVSAWAGEGFAWRIADPQKRALAILAECQLATCEGPADPEQSKFPFEFLPTITEEFNLQVESAKVASAIEAAGALPTNHQPPPQGGEHPSQFSGQCPENSSEQSVIEKPSAALRRHLASKDRLAVDGNVGQPANEHPPAASSAPATRPSQGGETLARQPTPSGERWLPGQRSDPAPGGESLAARPTTGGGRGPSEPPGDAGVGCLANDPGPEPGKTLAGQPTNPAAASLDARMSEPFSIHHQKEIHLPLHINGPASGPMENVAGAAGRMENGVQRAPDELLRRVFEVVKVDSDRLVDHWRLLLGSKPRQALALDVLGEIKIRRDAMRHGIGKPIGNFGAWFVSEFYKRAGIPRPTHKAKS